MILKNFLKISKLPIIGIGPMSKNCVDASIELSNEHNLSLMLIFSIISHKNIMMENYI